MKYYIDICNFSPYNTARPKNHNVLLENNRMSPIAERCASTVIQEDANIDVNCHMVK